MSFARSRRRSGFALPAVLAVTGVVTLIFLVAITASANLNAEALSARARVAFMERALTSEAQVAFVMATEPFGPRGIEIGDLRRVNESPGLVPTQSSGLPRAELFLDGRPYRMPGDPGLTLRLQDQAGMINIARLDDESLRRLAMAAGVEPSEAGDLAARYRDYVDTDQLEQIDGAEGREYPAGREAPNRALKWPEEWLSVLGARDAVDPRLWRSLRPSLATDDQEITANVNTADALTLQIRFGLTARQAERALEVRRERPLTSLLDLAAVSGAVVGGNPESIYTYPSGRIHFTIEDVGSNWVYRGRLAISPGHPRRAFWIDQTELLQRPDRTAGADSEDAPEFPYPSR